MAVFRVFILLAVSCVGFVSVTEIDYGLYTLVLNSDLLSCSFNKSRILDVTLLKIYTYDFKNDVNNSYDLNVSSAPIIASTNTSRRIRVFIPGYMSTIDSVTQVNVRNNLKNDPEAYLFMIDHQNYTARNGLDYIGSYEHAVMYYWSIGDAIADFLVEIINGGIDISLIELMGHSLGSQICGAVGERYYNKTGVLLYTIRASDPAGPCFSNAQTQYQLRSGLARYVECYHCNAGTLGTVNNLTDAYYYVNGGQAQPGCNTPTGINSYALLLQAATAATCNHNTCPIVLTLPAKDSGIWIATPCNSEANFESGACDSNGTTIAGVLSPTYNNRSYYFDTDGYDVTP